MRNTSKASTGLSSQSSVRHSAALATVGAPALAAPKPSARTLSRQAQQHARGSFVVPKQHQAALPDAQTRHILTRFTGGVNPARLAAVAAAGGIDQWFELQLTPSAIPDKQADALWGWFPILALTPAQKYARAKNGTETGWLMMQDLANWIMLRRMNTNRQLEEMMLDFWSNLLHVASPAVSVWVWRVEYAAMLRSHSLGKFSDMLLAAIQHPAMSLYLNNSESTAEAINENLGRELLECHTVGVGAGYTENDVVNSARLLTGFQVDTQNTQAQTYVPGDHWVGRTKVMQFSTPNANPDGRPVLKKYLLYLARHPATATRICTRLAVRFVSDNPSPALIASLAKVYSDSDTDIVPVLRALVASDEFQASVMQKVRTPVEDAVATWTALDVVVAQPHNALDAGNQFINVSKGIGQVVYDWPTPDAFPDLGPAWTDSGRILASMRAHWFAALGHDPIAGITYKAPMDWMPQLPTTFDNVVTYVVANTLYLACTPTMLQAACVATDYKSTDVIDSNSALINYKFPRLMVSILDTAEHLSR